MILVIYFAYRIYLTKILLPFWILLKIIYVELIYLLKKESKNKEIFDELIFNLFAINDFNFKIDYF